ncbi:PIG-L deacetylase family protein [Asanoa sp. NPDC050611]|uniref:PIG-L deacetylase family protein n=1 Tax=Asanoa sp. NPDC050611 TaxID=3157098 RepID=UPI0033DD7A6B
MSDIAPYESLPEDWERALAVVAHPDDLEFGSAAAVARWTAQGKEVVYCLVTSGEAGIDGLSPDETKVVREAEQRASAGVVGVSAVEFIGLPDGILEYGVALRREITAVVRRHRPDIVITNNFRETWDGAEALNQADHIATGRATLDAVRDAGNRWIFPEQGLEPWNKVRQVWAAGSPDGRHAVDITGTFDRGIESLQAHEAYLRGLGEGAFDPEEFLEGIGRAAGTRLGTRYAAPFEVFTINLF